ncbi:MAG: nitronate monooxygenase, partial [Pseudopedobacter saltans]
EIVLTKSFSGKYARGIYNTFMHHFEESTYLLPYPYQNILTKSFRVMAREKENAELVNIWVGQSMHPYSFESTKTILQELARNII